MIEINIKDKALYFATVAHDGQKRKGLKNLPYIVHPIEVGEFLENFMLSDEVVAAGYLHDVVEDTKFTLDDIRNGFGDKVATFVDHASEPDKSLSWLERKTHTILITKDLPLESKYLVCADKISNLNATALYFETVGNRDFSIFKTGEDMQMWYFTSLYKSIIANETENNGIFKLFKEAIIEVFPNAIL